MAWSELARFRKGKLWKDGKKRALTSLVGTSVHYESTLDSGNYDTPVDMDPVAVNNAQLDGWRVTNNSWHYALGIDKLNHPGEDGWVAFGGRQGQHWFKFRLERVLYVHWPTKDWDDIGGVADYDRANLSATIQQRDIGFGETINLGNSVEWRNLWNTPGGGEGWVDWKVSGSRLKEYVRVNQAARDWITTNHPPGTPLSETYFGFAFKLDYTDIPKRYLGEALSDKDDDIEDSDRISFTTALDELLFFMPLDDLWVEDADGNEIDGSRLQLKKRLYKEGSDYYLVVGQRVDLLNALPDGTLVFDPTLDDTVGASDEDANERQSGGSYSSTFSSVRCVSHTDVNNAFIGGFYFDMTDGPDNGDTIDVCYMTIYALSTSSGQDDPDVEMSFNNVDSANDFTAEADVLDRARTSTVTWSANSIGTGAVNSPSIVTPLQAVIDRAGYASGNPVVAIWRGRTDTDGGNLHCESYDGNAAEAASLHVEWTAPGAAPALALLGVGT